MNKRYFYLLSFVEGGAVMTTELIGAKLLAPYFGTSLYVWAATLGVTLGGLTLGYFLGGNTSAKYKNSINIVHYIIATTSILLFLMPWMSPQIMNHTIQLSLKFGVLLSLMFFLFPPLVFMGMVSPLLIKIITDDKEKAGKNAGNIYAISTTGGILFTFYMGFYMIPNFGLILPAVVSGGLLAFFPLFWFFKKKNSTSLLLMVLFVATIALSFTHNTSQSDKNVIYTRESLLGQIKVVDFENNNKEKIRAMLVNNTMQTVENLDNPNSLYWEYPQYILKFVQIFDKNTSKGLLLGVGGGTVLNRLDDMGYDTDAVEIDKHVINTAKKYFNMNSERKVYIEDARYFVRKQNEKTYDFIILDALKGESAPEHLLTKESITLSMKTLKNNGLFLINFYGYLDGDLGLAARSVIKTIIEAGYGPRIHLTSGTPDSRNMILAIAPSFGNNLDTLIHQSEFPDLSDAYILTDFNPKSNIFLLPGLRWRKLNNDWYFE